MKQHEIPPQFNNLWRVGGWHDETPHAQRLCEVLSYTRTASGRERVRVRFVESTDLFQSKVAYLSPHVLFPALR